MILQERQPPFTWVTTATNSPKVPGPASFRDDEAELLQFTVDFWGSPVRILLCQAPDQTADFIGDLRPPAARAGPPTPVQPKAGAMPADDGLWFHDDEDVSPAGPDAAQGGPGEPLDRGQGRPRSLALEHCDLVSQGEYLQGGVATRSRTQLLPTSTYRALPVEVELPKGARSRIWEVVIRHSIQ